MMDDALNDPWRAQREALGTFIRTQRELSNLSLRELSRLTRVSNAYLSQVERGLHDPTLRILSQIGEALQILALRADAAGWLEGRRACCKAKNQPSQILHTQPILGF